VPNLSASEAARSRLKNRAAWDAVRQ